MKNKYGFIAKGLVCGILTVAVSMCGISGIAAPETEKHYSPGYITLEGEQKYEKSGSVVTLLVTKDGEDWTSEEQWKSADGGEVAYYNECVLGEDKTYSFNFVLTESEIYTVLISSKTGGSDKKEIVYINEDRNKSAINNILSIDGINIPVDLISGNLADLGVFAFETGDVSAAAATILGKALENKTDIAWDEMAVLTEKAILSAKIKEGTAKSFYEYRGLNMLEDKIFDYCGEEIAENVITAIKDVQIDEIEDFDNALLEQTVLQLANGNDDEAVLAGVLNEYSGKLGVNRTITTAIAKAAIIQGNFANCTAVVNFVNGYDTPAPPLGGPSGYIPGKGSPTVDNNYDYATSAGEKTKTEKPSEISVFEDIEDVDWARAAITELYKKKVINGKTENLFCPNDYVTREEFAKILMLAFDVNLVDEECPFIDVDESDWSYDYIRTAYLAGVVNGIGDNIFGKVLNITRQDLCTMVYRLIKIGNSELDAESGMSFADADEISDYAKEAVGVMQNCRIINGDNNGRFNPNNNATRAEAVKIVYNAMLMYENSK